MRRRLGRQGALPSSVFGIEELFLESGDPNVRGIQLAPQEFGVLECAGGLGGQRL
jgi:hypothetical protein